MKSQKSEHEIIIEAHKSWLYFDWRGMIHYRDLLALLVRRDFVSKYKQTILGPAWFILQPLLMTFVFTIIFGKVARISTDGIPSVLFYLCGLAVWGYFAQCLGGVSSSLVVNANLFSKVYFPRIIIPLSIIASSFFTFLLQFATFLGFYLYYKFFTPAGGHIDFNRVALILPFLFIEMMAIGLGVGLWIASLTVKYRDFQHLVPFMAQLWMYATPVIYPVSALPVAWRFVMAVNPMAGIVESYRFAFFGTGFMDPGYLMISAGVTLLIFVSGLFYFNKVQRTFVDTI